jgi:hypothetical protein
MLVTKVEDKTAFGNTINVIYTNVLSYDLREDDCKLRYELRFRDPNRISPAIPDTVVGSGIWDVPTNVLNAWSGSNTYLVEKLCESFDLTIIEHLPV